LMKTTLHAAPLAKRSAAELSSVGDSTSGVTGTSTASGE
jgi:hypothetical protein